MLTLQLELMEKRWARHRDGEAGPKSLQLYQQSTNTLRRCLKRSACEGEAGCNPCPADYARNYDRHAQEDAEDARR